MDQLDTLQEDVASLMKLMRRSKDHRAAASWIMDHTKIGNNKRILDQVVIVIAAVTTIMTRESSPAISTYTLVLTCVATIGAAINAVTRMQASNALHDLAGTHPARLRMIISDCRRSVDSLLPLVDMMENEFLRKA